MPTARIEIEHTHDSWFAEVEAGGIMARCRALRADSFDAILRAVAAAYREMAGDMRGAAPPPDAPAEPPAPPRPSAPAARPARTAEVRR